MTAEPAAPKALVCPTVQWVYEKRALDKRNTTITGFNIFTMVTGGRVAKGVWARQQTSSLEEGGGGLQPSLRFGKKVAAKAKVTETRKPRPVVSTVTVATATPPAAAAPIVKSTVTPPPIPATNGRNVAVQVVQDNEDNEDGEESIEKDDVEDDDEAELAEEVLQTIDRYTTPFMLWRNVQKSKGEKPAVGAYGKLPEHVKARFRRSSMPPPRDERPARVKHPKPIHFFPNQNQLWCADPSCCAENIASLEIDHKTTL